MKQHQSYDPYRLQADAADAPAQVAGLVDALLAAETDRPRLRLLLGGDALPAETIAGLVTGLRRLREFGGAIEVRPETAAVRDALALTGLEHVFAFPLDPDDAPRRHRFNFGFGSRVAAGLFIAVVTAIGFPAGAADEQPPTDPATILARVEQRNPTLSSYEGRLHVDVHMTSFPFIGTHLDATTYYKRPANYEVVFDRVPALAKGFDKMFTDIGDPASWEHRFAITYVGEQPFRGHADLALRMVQRVRGMIDHETVLVDPNAWSIDSIRYDYYNGGHITMTQTFRDVGGYSMLAEQDAEIAIPYARARAHGVYSDYRTNVALDDSVFTKKR
ncbi:MAG TPA: hypothetical protein VMD91_12920 [Candidatus Sulfotelmatobacter sp.]|nr:hypothetical protein [Candidatus Sulfotelmatobacter sp.]